MVVRCDIEKALATCMALSQTRLKPSSRKKLKISRGHTWIVQPSDSSHFLHSGLSMASSSSLTKTYQATFSLSRKASCLPGVTKPMNAIGGMRYWVFSSMRVPAKCSKYFKALSATVLSCLSLKVCRYWPGGLKPKALTKLGFLK